MDTQLSPHFALSEFTRSQTAARMGLDNTPGTAELQQLARLCQLVLEPVRVALDTPIWIDSGYRCPALNKAVGGARASDHMKGMAADLRAKGLTALALAREIAAQGELEALPFRIVINEYDRWVHVSLSAEDAVPMRLERTAVRAVMNDGLHHTVYVPGLMPVQQALREAETSSGLQVRERD